MLAEKVVLVNGDFTKSETNMTTQETNPVGADAIMWTAPIVEEENGDCLFAYVTPKPKRVVAGFTFQVTVAQSEDDARFAELRENDSIGRDESRGW